MSGRRGGVTEDRLLGGAVTVRQPREGFRVAIDTVLLAAAVPAEDGQTVLEPGAGIGAAALCLARRVPGCRVVGLERRADLVGLAGENARLNRLERRIDVMVGDLARPPPRLVPGAYDHVMMNPPFFAAGTTARPDGEARAAARIEGEADLAAWIGFASGMLRRKGTLTLIHRAERLADVLAALSGRCGEIAVFPLWPRAGAEAAKRVLVRARTGVATPLRLLGGMALHTADGAYTPRAEAVLRGGPLAL